MQANFPSARGAGILSSPPMALSATPSLLNLWLVQTPKKVCNLRLAKLCVFSVCVLPHLLFFPTMTVGMGFNSLLQIKSSPKGSKPSYFHSQPHSDKTPLQTELRREIRDASGNKAVDSHTPYSKF